MKSDDLIAGALERDPAAMRALVDHLTPVIQARVARALMRRRASALGRDIRQELEDLTQEIFLSLFDDDARALRAWSPEKGLSLLNFVGLVAERQVASIMRSGRRSPWTEDPTDDMSSHVDHVSVPPASPEARVGSQELLQVVLSRLRSSLSPMGLQVFELLVVQQCPVAEVGLQMGLDAGAVYAWRSRLKRLAQSIQEELEAEPAAASS